MKFGVCTPTRGIVYTKTAESIEKARKGHDVSVYYSHNLPIPDGHNELVREALKDGCDYVIMVEEDIIVPENLFSSIIEANSDIAFVDYSVQGYSCSARNDKEILWCGVGCTAIKKEVLLSLDDPWFRTDKTLRLNDWTWVDLPEEYIKNKQYGSLDIWFCCKAREKGFKIKQIDGECPHLLLEKLGERETNNGLHMITERPRIKTIQIIKN